MNHPSAAHECTDVRILSRSRPARVDRAGGHRHEGRARLGAALAVAVGVLGGAAAQPAAADVTLVPDTGTQGYAAEIAFRVTEDRAPAAYTTRLEIVMPDLNPIAEVYPLSDDVWAPRIAYRTLPSAVPGLHGTESDQVVSAIAWVRFGKPATPPTASTVDEVRVSLGPLPQTDTARFLVVQTYSDGVVKRWVDPVLTLTPPAGQSGQSGQLTVPALGRAGAHAPAHGAAIPGAAQPGAAPAESSGGHLGVVVGVLVALVVGVAIGGAAVASGRLRPGGGDVAPWRRG